VESVEEYLMLVDDTMGTDLGGVFSSVERLEDGMLLVGLTTKGRMRKADLHALNPDVLNLYEQLLTKGWDAFPWCGYLLLWFVAGPL
jgi:hypothetical protein